MAAGSFGFLILIQLLNELIRSLIPGFWVKLDTPQRLGSNEKRFGCSLLNLPPNRIMQTRRYIRLLALLKLGDVLPSETIGRVV
jgi:hypothetical protein